MVRVSYFSSGLRVNLFVLFCRGGFGVCNWSEEKILWNDGKKAGLSFGFVAISHWEQLDLTIMGFSGKPTIFPWVSRTRSWRATDAFSWTELEFWKAAEFTNVLCFDIVCEKCWWGMRQNSLLYCWCIDSAVLTVVKKIVFVHKLSKYIELGSQIGNSYGQFHGFFFYRVASLPRTTLKFWNHFRTIMEWWHFGNICAVLIWITISMLCHVNRIITRSDLFCWT